MLRNLLIAAVLAISFSSAGAAGEHWKSMNEAYSVASRAMQQGAYGLAYERYKQAIDLAKSGNESILTLRMFIYPAAQAAASPPAD